jgi:hypothetical protein
MAEFYWQPSFGHGGESRSSEPLPKEKSLLEKSLDEIQKKADAVLREALELAKSGREQDKEKIDERIQVYKQLTSIIPAGFDEARVKDIRKHFEYNRRLAEIEKQLKKDIFG